MAQLFNMKLDEDPTGRGPNRYNRPGARMGITIPSEDDLLDAIRLPLADATTRPVGSPLPYACAWFTWELLRRSPEHRERDENWQDWWHWDRPFPHPQADGSCPAEHAELARTLAGWIAPHGIQAMHLDWRGPTPHPDARGGRPAVLGDPHVHVIVELRSSPESLAKAFRALQRLVGVKSAKLRPWQPWWGNTLTAPQAIELWERSNTGAGVSALARETLANPGTRRRAPIRSTDPALIAR